jgi:hypothetical protein
VRIGITGDRQLEDEAASEWVEHTLVELLNTVAPPLVGVTALATPTEQLFARSVLRCGGQLHAIVPFAGYERTLAAAELARYRALLAEARTEQLTGAERSAAEAQWQARRRVVDLSDEVIAVWDGGPAATRGDCAEVVEYALKTEVPLVQLNPLSRTAERLR